jgi:xylose dehydrogenase (NAD/NADP)
MQAFAVTRVWNVSLPGAGVPDPVRWGLLSTAAINDPVLEGCKPSTAVDFVAVASRDREKASAWARDRGIPRAHGSYEDLLSDPDIEAVYISLPNSMHIQWAVRSLEAGKHVLCEKPLGRDARRVSEAFDAAARAGKLLVEAFMYRFHPQTDEIRRLIGDGAIGELRHIRATLSFAMRFPGGDVRASSSLDGGALMDVGCYCVSAYRLLAGEPSYVEGYAIADGLTVDSRFLGILASEGGITGQFDCGMNLPRRDALEIVGEEGAIFVPDPWHCRGAPFELHQSRRSMSVTIDRQDAYRVEFEAISRAIRDGSALEFGRDDAVSQALAIAALHASAQRKARAGRSSRGAYPPPRRADDDAGAEEPAGTSRAGGTTRR